MASKPFPLIPTQPPFYAKFLKPGVGGCLTAAVFAAFPDRVHFVQPLSLDLEKILPGYLGPLTVRAYVALVGFVLGFGFGKGLGWTRWILLRRLFADQGWMLQPKSTRTRIWALLVKLLKGPRPYSTYEFQRMLPNQPLPALNQTLDLWLRGNTEWMSEEELTCTRQAVEHFRNNEGPILQRHLEARASREVSWLHEYWLSAAYLANRDPLPINSNYFSCAISPDNWTTDSVVKSATVLRLMLEYAELIESETMNPVTLLGLVPLCMNGFKFMFNTVRVPGENMDSVVRHTGHRHVVVVRKGQYFVMELMARSETGRRTLLTAAEIRDQLSKIVQMSDEGTERCDVAALTTQNRTQWAKHREVLMKTNRDTLHTVESALCFLSLDDDYVIKDASDQCRRVLVGTGNDRWFDKGVSTVCFAEGQLGHNIEHSALDATIFVTFSEYQAIYEKYTNGNVYMAPGEIKRELPTPKRLTWDTSQLDAEIATALAEYREKIEDFEELVVTPPYGKGFMKKQGLSPDGYIQMAMQLAFYRLHKKVPKTYEPSTGRLFALGRTETIHVTSPKSTEWLKSMDDSSASPETKRQLLKKAIECQNSFRLQATRGQGCDRHLLGLFMASRELGMDVPQIFMDKAWRSPYQLSTSQTPTEAFNYGVRVDFKGVNGGFGPYYKDGYGISYVIHGDDIINFSMSAYKSSEEAKLHKFADSLLGALEDMRTFLEKK